MLSNRQLSYPVLKQLRLAVHVVGILALVGTTWVAWGIRNSIQSWQSSIEEQVFVDVQLLRETAKIESQLEEALETRDRVSASFRGLRDRVPARLIDSDILKQIDKIVSACDCKLNDLRPIGNQRVETKELKCKVRSFQLSMSGTYVGLFAFARALDDFPFLLQLKKLHLAAPQESESRCRIELEIGVLYSPEWAESELVTSDRT